MSRRGRISSSVVRDVIYEDDEMHREHILSCVVYDVVNCIIAYNYVITYVVYEDETCRLHTVLDRANNDRSFQQSSLLRLFADHSIRVYI